MTINDESQPSFTPLTRKRDELIGSDFDKFRERIARIFKSKETQLDAASSLESEQNHNVEQSAAECFQKDTQFIIDLFQRIEKSTTLNRDKLIVSFAALLHINPNDPLGMPILIMRPIDRPQKHESMYFFSSGASMLHSDIYDDWRLLTEEKPNDKRTAVFNFIDRELGGYDELEHIYLNVQRDANNKIVLEIEAGWEYFQRKVSEKIRPHQLKPQLTREEGAELLRQLKKYNIDGVRTDEDGNFLSIEKIILDKMMKPIIQKNAEKLRAVITPRAVKEYKNLAHRFLTNPNPDKSSPLYARFLEFEEILQRLDN